MGKIYGKALHGSFCKYYERFRELHALSEDTAVTKEELFPNGCGLWERRVLHEMTEFGVVKKAPGKKYWLNEELSNNPDRVLNQRLILVAVALVLGIILGLLSRCGIINL